MKHLFALGFALLLGAGAAHAQDPHFSQFYANPLYLNPAMAGATKCPKVNMIYRNQYPALGAFRTIGASYDQFVNDISGGLGLLVTNDNAGDGTLGITEVSAIYSYHLTVSREVSVLVGFQAGYRQRMLDWSSLEFGDEIHNLYGFVLQTQEIQGEDQVGHVDLSTGFVLFTDIFYLGGAFHHLTQPNDPFLVESTLPMKMTFHGGAQIPIGGGRLASGSTTTLNPGLLYQQQGEFQQMNFLLSVTREVLTGGLAFRHNVTNADALVVLVGFQPTDALSIGYSYDFTVSEFSNQEGGAHEISLSYQFECKPKKKKFKTINCPKF
ncbi:MAG: PorP/SprF family type IX secretion system membrane protein [Flavobacteriales bacterium]|nr:PorP/SprF family type IX secretion system membrane protein [Flavobacteriales bacterium]